MVEWTSRNEREGKRSRGRTLIGTTRGTNFPEGRIMKERHIEFIYSCETSRTAQHSSRARARRLLPQPCQHSAVHCRAPPLNLSVDSGFLGRSVNKFACSMNRFISSSQTEESCSFIPITLLFTFPCPSSMWIWIFCQTNVISLCSARNRRHQRAQVGKLNMQTDFFSNFDSLFYSRCRRRSAVPLFVEGGCSPFPFPSPPPSPQPPGQFRTRNHIPRIDARHRPVTRSKRSQSSIGQSGSGGLVAVRWLWTGLN